MLSSLTSFTWANSLKIVFPAHLHPGVILGHDGVDTRLLDSKLPGMPIMAVLFFLLFWWNFPVA